MSGSKSDRAIAAGKRATEDITHALAQKGHLFQTKGWDIQFQGWRTPINQMIEFGVWTATRDGVSEIWYSTTLGVTARLERELDPINLAIVAGHKLKYSSEVERQEAASAAARALIAALPDLDT